MSSGVIHVLVMKAGRKRELTCVEFKGWLKG
jgi:hypothetical protein